MDPVMSMEEIRQQEYRDMGWEAYGFSFEAFLRWRSVDQTHVITVNRVTPSHDDGASALLTADDFPPHLDVAAYDDTLYRRRLVNPIWADRWAEHFHEPKEALQWYFRGMDVDDAVMMKAMRFRKAGTAQETFRLLKDSGLIPVIRNRGLKLASMPKGIVRGTDDDGRGLPAILRVCLDPEFGLTEGQIDTVLSHCPPTQVAGRGFGGTTSQPNFKFAGIATNYATTLASAIHHIQSKFGALPEGDGSFSWLAFRCSVPNSSRHDAIGYPSTVLRGLIDQAESLDQLKEFFISFSLLAERTGTDGSWFTHWAHASIGRLVYSVKTGVPFDWADDDIGLSVSLGRSDEVPWTKPDGNDPHVEYITEADLKFRAGEHLVAILKKEHQV